MIDEKDRRPINSLALAASFCFLSVFTTGLVILFDSGPEPADAHSGLVRAETPGIECESGRCTVSFRWMSPACERTLRNAMRNGGTTGHQIEEDCFAGTE